MTNSTQSYAPNPLFNIRKHFFKIFTSFWSIRSWTHNSSVLYMHIYSTTHGCVIRRDRNDLLRISKQYRVMSEAFASELLETHEINVSSLLIVVSGSRNNRYSNDWELQSTLSRGWVKYQMKRIMFIHCWINYNSYFWI